VSLSTVGGGDTNELVQTRVSVRDRVLGIRAPPSVTAGRPHLIGSSFSRLPGGLIGGKRPGWPRSSSAGKRPPLPRVSPSRASPPWFEGWTLWTAQGPAYAPAAQVPAGTG